MTAKAANGNVLFAEIGQVRRDIGRLEKGVENLHTEFAASSTKQGERIGIVEDGLLALRVGAKAVLIISGIVWTLVQGLAFAAFGWWLTWKFPR